MHEGQPVRMPEVRTGSFLFKEKERGQSHWIKEFMEWHISTLASPTHVQLGGWRGRNRAAGVREGAVDIIQFNQPGF